MTESKVCIVCELRKAKETLAPTQRATDVDALFIGASLGDLVARRGISVKAAFDVVRTSMLCEVCLGQVSREAQYAAIVGSEAPVEALLHERLRERSPPQAAPSITHRISCLLCFAETQSFENSSLEVGFTEVGLQVRCLRHKTNVIHVDFEGRECPANPMAEDPPPESLS